MEFTNESGVEYLMGIEKLYKENKINKEDYYAMIGAVRIICFNEPEDKIIQWVKEQLRQEELESKEEGYL